MTQTPFWDRVADRYATRAVGDPDAYEQTLSRVSQWLKPDHKAVELGCGTGSTALRLAEHVAEYRGTDGSSRMIEIARAKEAPAHLRFDAVDASDALSGSSPDVVLAFNLLHLLEDLPATLVQIRDALPTGGLFISKTPCLAGKWWLRPIIGAMQIVGKAPAPVAYLRADPLVRAVENAGFVIEEVGDYPPKLPSRFIVACKRG